MNRELKRLMELTGYRDNIEAKTFKQIMSTSGKKRDRLVEFLYYMEKRGFKSLGNGAFGAVFKHPGLDYCIKLFKNDPAYLQFIKVCAQHKDNPHLPRFRGKFMKIDNQHYAVRMEILTSIEGDFWRDVLTRLVWGNSLKHIDDDASKYLQENPSIKKTLELLEANSNGYSMDLHNGNFMLRGNTLVFTDPYWVGRRHPTTSELDDSERS